MDGMRGGGFLLCLLPNYLHLGTPCTMSSVPVVNIQCLVPWINAEGRSRVGDPYLKFSHHAFHASVVTSIRHCPNSSLRCVY